MLDFGLLLLLDLLLHFGRVFRSRLLLGDDFGLSLGNCLLDLLFFLDDSGDLFRLLFGDGRGNGLHAGFEGSDSFSREVLFAHGFDFFALGGLVVGFNELADALVAEGGETLEVLEKTGGATHDSLLLLVKGVLLD